MLHIIKLILLLSFGVFYSGCTTVNTNANTAVNTDSLNKYKHLPPIISNPLTPQENFSSIQLPNTYFDNSTWDGYYRDFKTNEVFYLKATFFNNDLKSPYPKVNGEMLIMDKNKNFVHKYKTLLHLPTAMFTINATENPQSNKNLVFKFTRGGFEQNHIHGNFYLPKDSDKNEAKGIFMLQRNEPYKLAEPYLFPENDYDKEDIIKIKTKNFDTDNNSNIYLKTNKENISQLLFMKDDKDLLSLAANTKTVVMKDIVSSQIKQRYLAQTGGNLVGSLYSMALHPNQKILAVSGHFDAPTLKEFASIKIFNIETGKIIAQAEGHSESPRDLTFSNDGKYLFSISMDYSIQVFETNTFSPIKKISFYDAKPLDGEWSKPKILVIDKKDDYYIVAAWNDNVAVFSMKSGKKLYHYMHLCNIHSIAYNNSEIIVVGSDMNVQTGNREVVVLNENLKFLKYLDFPLDKNQKLPMFSAFNKDNTILAISSPQKIVLYDAKKSYSYIKEIVLKDFKKYQTELVTMTFKNNTQIAIADVQNETSLINISSSQKEELFPSPNKNLMVQGGVAIKDNIIRWAVNNEKELGKEYSFDLVNMQFTKSNIKPKIPSFSNDKYVLTHENNLRADGHFIVQTKGIMPQKKYVVLPRDMVVNTGGFYKDYILILGLGNISIFKPDGSFVAQLMGHNDSIYSFSIDGDRLITTGFDGVLNVWDLKLIDESKIQYRNFKECTLVQQNDMKTIFPKINFESQDMKKITDQILESISKSPDERTSWYYFLLMKPQTIKPLISFYPLDNGEWIMWTAEGYFNSSENVVNHVGYYINQGFNKEATMVSMDKLYDHFFRPDLVKLKLKGEDISKYTNDVTYKEVLQNLPPTVSIASINGTAIGSSNKKAALSTPTAKVSFTVTENNGGVGLIRIYQEGKLVKTIGSGQVNRQSADADAKAEETKIDKKSKEAQSIYLAKLEDTVTKSLGREFNTNELVESVSIDNGVAISTKGTHTIELPLKAGNNTISIEAFNKTNTVASYRDSVSINASIKPKDPKIYAIALGVNEFEQSSVSALKYSENDANEIAAKIKKATSYQTDVTLLTGANMTKENIQKALQNIKAKAGLEDKVIFYVSTHGKAVNGNLFLVPQNNKSVKNWINFEELFKEIQSISALNQIFIIDACESGKASDIMASVYDAKASVLAKQSGVHVLMATTKGTFAFEHPDKNVQHGVFTYNILKALDDPKTDKNGDKWISIVELSKALQEPSNNVEQQFPIIRNVGQDTNIKQVGK